MLYQFGLEGKGDVFRAHNLNQYRYDWARSAGTDQEVLLPEDTENLIPFLQPSMCDKSFNGEFAFPPKWKEYLALWDGADQVKFT